LTPNVVTHFIQHREEIRDLLQRHGWFSAQRRLYKAPYRKVAAHTSVVTAPVAGPADILAKLQARNRSCEKPDFEDVEADAASEEDALMVTIRRDLEALSGPRCHDRARVPARARRARDRRAVLLAIYGLKIQAARCGTVMP